MGLLLKKNKDNPRNATQEKVSSGGGGFGHENMRDCGVSQPSGGGFGGTTISNSAFVFGCGPSSGGGFGNTNQYRDGGNGTENQGGSDGNLSYVHHTIFKMMEPHYKKIRGTIHLKHLMESGVLAHNNGTLLWVKHYWHNNKRMICWHNMLGCC